VQYFDGEGGEEEEEREEEEREEEGEEEEGERREGEESEGERGEEGRGGERVILRSLRLRDHRTPSCAVFLLALLVACYVLMVD
jgi:hypothetical protein